MKVFFTALFILVHAFEASSLRCYVCRSIEIVGVSDATAPGCHEPTVMSADYLTVCSADEPYCRVLKITGNYDNSEVLTYDRSCAKYVEDTCQEESGTTNCFHSCTTDGCNDISTLPSEVGRGGLTVGPPVFESAPTTKAATTTPVIVTTKEAMTTVAESIGKSTAEPDERKPTSPPPEKTTSDAQVLRARYAAILNLVLCAIMVACFA